MWPGSAMYSIHFNIGQNQASLSWHIQQRCVNRQAHMQMTLDSLYVHKHVHTETHTHTCTATQIQRYVKSSVFEKVCIWHSHSQYPAQHMNPTPDGTACLRMSITSVHVDPNHAMEVGWAKVMHNGSSLISKLSLSLSLTVSLSHTRTHSYCFIDTIACAFFFLFA